MNDGIFSNLARATRLAADHQCAGYRFWMVLHLLGCITLQNDADGVFIGIDTVEDFLLEGDPDDLYAVMHRDGSGLVVDIDHWPAFIGTEPLAAMVICGGESAARQERTLAGRLKPDIFSLDMCGG
ncbi:hypothetical protein [Brevundimonas sp. Root1423]|uniref:hypothetical protein n=1 Tax=Brevundimonas sp. Root1423 TaxID=1736462 RepID=UPI0006F1FFE5|nr:hypothetical protein [Brevundimonas sp. Root1423]KQY89775.1 hypothetical protein ASD25_04390 [Brevundimonas sp. Root1423]